MSNRNHRQSANQTVMITEVADWSALWYPENRGVSRRLFPDVATVVTFIASRSLTSKPPSTSPKKPVLYKNNSRVSLSSRISLAKAFMQWPEPKARPGRLRLYFCAFPHIAQKRAFGVRSAPQLEQHFSSACLNPHCVQNTASCGLPAPHRTQLFSEPPTTWA